MATHPEDADTVIQILAAEERRKLDVHLQFFQEMLAREEVVHAWQLEEPVLKMLRRLVEVFTLSNERAAIGPTSEPPITVERGVAVEASLMEPKESDAQPAASDATANPDPDGTASPTG